MSRLLPRCWPQRGVSPTRANVAIAVADEARGYINEIAATCRALGLAHTSTLFGVGVLLGSVELQDLPRVRAVPGVALVEVERGFRFRDLRVRGD